MKELVLDILLLATALCPLAMIGIALHFYWTSSQDFKKQAERRARELDDANNFWRKK